MATLVPCLVKLRAEFNALAPDRDKASDGWIGDPAHAARTSDHNPDLRGLVHAIDVDVDLRRPGLSMEKVVQLVLARCQDGRERRLRYIIYNRRIWSASNGWRQQAYTGANAHDHHAHFSASHDPAREESTAPWNLEALDMALDATDQTRIRTIVREELDSFGDREPLSTMFARSTENRARTSDIQSRLAGIAGGVAAIVPQDIDEDALATSLAAKLPDDADDITPAELKQAIVAAVQELLGTTPTGA